jgi:hypothetical protein
MMQFVDITVSLKSFSDGHYVSFLPVSWSRIGNHRYLPIVMAVTGALSGSPSAGRSGLRWRSPRKLTPAITTDLPPSMMFCLPSIWARLEILLPVSYDTDQYLQMPRPVRWEY